MDSLPVISRSFLPKRVSSSFYRGADTFKRHQGGFTLLELLSVVLIIGIVVSFASLSVGQKNSHVVRDEAERLNGLLKLANEEAVMQGRELAVEFKETGYSFMELSSENKWSPVTEDKLLREREFPPTIKIKLTIEGVVSSFEDKKNLPRIFVLSSGELTPFQLTLSLDGEESYILQGAIDGKLTLTSAGEHKFES